MTRRAQSGFVLAVTLWILAAIAIVAAMVSLWAISGVQDATRYQEEVEDEVDAYSTLQTVLYLAATRDMTLAGLPTRRIDRAEYAKRVLEEFGALRVDPVGGELTLDDRAYHGLGATRFSIQDEAGLMGFSPFGEAGATRLLSSEPAAERQLGKLRDSLLDYVDEDGNARTQGAEAAAYGAKAGEPMPANRRMATPMELERVLGWNTLPSEALARLREKATVYYVGPLNINTAPEAVLAQYLPGCPDTCRTLAELRRQAPIRNTDELQRRLVVTLPGTPETDFRTMPEGQLRLTAWARSGHGWRLHVELTPEKDKAGPWTILAAYPVFVTPRDAEPTRSALLAQAPPGSR